MDAAWLMDERNVPQPGIAPGIRSEHGGQSRVEGIYAAGLPDESLNFETQPNARPWRKTEAVRADGRARISHRTRGQRPVDVERIDGNRLSLSRARRRWHIPLSLFPTTVARSRPCLAN
jgi:hypothetical protein